MDENDPLPADEQAAFDALPRALEPPPGLEQRVVNRLRAGGFLSRRHRLSRSLAAAAALVTFAAGFAAGRGWPTVGSTTAGQRYMLLLYDGETASPDAEAARVAEYSAWARQEAAAGHLSGGERLSPDATVLGRAAAGATRPSGFFLIRATSRSEAQAVAARCPHLRHGGTLVLRRIVDTGS